MTRRPLLLIMVVALLGIGLLTNTADADAGQRTASITDVHADASTIDGVLTVSDAGHAIDPNSVTVAFGDRSPVRASVTPLARESRAAIILIDTSGSMAGAGLTAAKSAARTFLDRVPAPVRVGLASFADKPQLLVRPTAQRGPVLSALRALRAVGSTSLYDAVAAVLGELGATGSRTILVLSDGADSGSATSLPDVEAILRASGVRLVAVGFRTGVGQNGVLANLAHAGQGAFTQALDTASLQRAFGSAAQDLASQARFTVPVPTGVGGSQHVTVTGTAAGRTFSATTVIALPAVRRPDHPASSAVPVVAAPPSHSHLIPLLAAAAVFLGVFALCLVLAGSRVAPAAKRRIRRLDDYLDTSRPEGPTETARSLQGMSDGLTRAADAYISKRPSTARTRMLLERADLPLQLNEWYVLRLLAIPITAALLWLLLNGSGSADLLIVAGTAVIGVLLPAAVLRSLASWRARRFELQLPDVLTLVASSLSTGFSLPQAIDAITRDAAEPAAKEFSRALAETRIGIELEDALDRVATRMDSTNLTWTTMAIRIQRRVGGNLSGVLRTTAATLRERETLKRQVRALSAEGRLSAYILIALPIVLAGYLYISDRSYLALLWHRPLGIFMLCGSALLLVVGIVWMRRLVEVKV